MNLSHRQKAIIKHFHSFKPELIVTEINGVGSNYKVFLYKKSTGEHFEEVVSRKQATDWLENMKTFYAVYVDSVNGRCVFPTKADAEEFRNSEIENSFDPTAEPDVSEVFEVYMTEEEYKNIPED